MTQLSLRSFLKFCSEDSIAVSDERTFIGFADFFIISFHVSSHLEAFKDTPSLFEEFSKKKRPFQSVEWCEICFDTKGSYLTKNEFTHKLHKSLLASDQFHQKGRIRPRCRKMMNPDNMQHGARFENINTSASG